MLTGMMRLLKSSRSGACFGCVRVANDGFTVALVMALSCLAGGIGVADDDGQWTMPAKNHASTRFSELHEIQVGNASRLTLAWQFSTGTDRGLEAAPIVADGRMFVVTPYPNVLYGFDLKSPGQPAWKYEPRPAAAARGVACCDVVNRGAAYSNGRVFFNTLDCHTIAVEASTGREIWKTQVGDYHIGEAMTMAPLVVKDKVLVGNSGGVYGVRGWIKALDAASGKVVWTGYNTGPDVECLIGEEFRPFYPQDRGKDLGVTTWPAEQWKLGGANLWGWISYDPELNLLFHGTGNPGVWNPDLRPGANKWSSGIFARNPDTGRARWYYQWSPHDIFEHDGVNENILLDLPLGFDGSERKVLVHPDRNGYLYVLDRSTGEVLSATPFVRITASNGVDLKTGLLQHNEAKFPAYGKVIRDVAPASPGGKDWQPSAYSPRTKLLYLPHQTMAMDYEGADVNYIAGTPYVGVNIRMYADPVAPGDGSRGAFTAWDIIGCKQAWRLKEWFPVWSGALATAGDVVFYGTMEGWFKAVDARTGELLWKYRTESGIIGQPITYRGPDGRQYVAILAGVGGWAGLVVAGDLDTRDPSAARGFANAMKDLKEHTKKGGRLYVFSLPKEVGSGEQR